MESMPETGIGNRSLLRLALGLTLGSAAFFSGSREACGAPGDLDPTFRGNGKVPLAGAVYGGAASLSPDGTIVVLSRLVDGPARITRLKTDGALDTTFGNGGRVQLALEDARDLASQADGAVVVAGQSDDTVFVTRRAKNGSLDATFGLGGTASLALPGSVDITSVVLQGDGKILVVGSLDSAPLVVRFNEDGGIDGGFAGGYATIPVPNREAFANAARVDPSGRILLVGNAFGEGGVDPFVQRLTTTGQIDRTFASRGAVVLREASAGLEGGFGYDLALSSDGTGVFVAGFRDDLRGFTAKFSLYRLRSNGTRDVSFAPRGLRILDVVAGKSDVAKSLVLEPSGGSTLGGSAIQQSGGSDLVHSALVRATPTGLLDSSFGVGGRRLFLLGKKGSQVVTLLRQGDGRLVALHETYATNPSGQLVRTLLVTRHKVS